MSESLASFVRPTSDDDALERLPSLTILGGVHTVPGDRTALLVRLRSPNPLRSDRGRSQLSRLRRLLLRSLAHINRVVDNFVCQLAKEEQLGRLRTCSRRCFCPSAACPAVPPNIPEDFLLSLLFYGVTAIPWQNREHTAAHNGRPPRTKAADHARCRRSASSRGAQVIEKKGHGRQPAHREAQHGLTEFVVAAVLRVHRNSSKKPLVQTGFPTVSRHVALALVQLCRDQIRRDDLGVQAAAACKALGTSLTVCFIPFTTANRVQPDLERLTEGNQLQVHCRTPCASPPRIPL